MMRKTFFYQAAILVACTLFVACGDDDDDAGAPSSPSITYAGKLPTQVGDYKFSYDDNDRCYLIKESSYTLSKIDYDKGKIYVDGDECDVKFNSNGYISEISGSWEYYDGDDEYGAGSGTVKFSYDSNGYLTSLSTSSSEKGVDEGDAFSYSETWTTKYTYGSTVKISNTITEEEKSSEGWKDTYSWQYLVDCTGDANPTGQYSVSMMKAAFDYEEFGVAALAGLFGKAYKVFPETITEIDDYHEYPYTVSFTLNDDSTISKEKCGSDSYSYSYLNVDSRATETDDNLTESWTSKHLLRSLFMHKRDR